MLRLFTHILRLPELSCATGAEDGLARLGAVGLWAIAHDPSGGGDRSHPSLLPLARCSCRAFCLALVLGCCVASVPAGSGECLGGVGGLGRRGGRPARPSGARRGGCRGRLSCSPTPCGHRAQMGPPRLPACLGGVHIRICSWRALMPRGVGARTFTAPPLPSCPAPRSLVRFPRSAAATTTIPSRELETLWAELRRKDAQVGGNGGQPTTTATSMAPPEPRPLALSQP